MLVGKSAIAGPKGFKKGAEITEEAMAEYPRSQWFMFAVEDEKAQGEIEALRTQYDESKSRLEALFMDKVEKVQRRWQYNKEYFWHLHFNTLSYTESCKCLSALSWLARLADPCARKRGCARGCARVCARGFARGCATRVMRV